MSNVQKMAETKRLVTPDGTPPAYCTLIAPHHGNSLLQVLHQMYLEEQLCDYTVITEGQKFTTHKNVLAAVSDYFKAMLTGSMLEARQEHVELKGVTATAVKVLIDFAYTGKLEINMDSVIEILGGACHFQIQSVIELCSGFLKQEISAHNCVDILNMGDLFSLCSVADCAMQFIISHFEKILESDSLYKLRKDHLDILLQHDLLPVLDELTLFNGLIRWIDFDPLERSQVAPDLLRHIRFVLMKSEELVDYVSKTRLMMTNSQCRQYLDEALHYQLLPQRQPSLQTPQTQVRNKPSIVAFGGRYGIHVGQKYNSNKMFVLHDDHWTQLHNSEWSFLYSAVTVVDNFMYVCGGMGKPAHARATCLRFDPRNCSWIKLADMKNRRQSFPLVGFNGRLYAFGGGTPYDAALAHPPTAKSEAYSIKKNEWCPISPLPTKAKSSSACELAGEIYVSGGRTEEETLRTFWSYSPLKDQWTRNEPMLEAHAGHAIVGLVNKVYTVDRMTMSIEVYDIMQRQWNRLTAPSTNFTGVARPLVDGSNLYFISYTDSGDKSGDYRCTKLNVVTQQMESLPEFPGLVHCVISATLAFPKHFLVDSNNNP